MRSILLGVPWEIPRVQTVVLIRVVVLGVLPDVGTRAVRPLSAHRIPTVVRRIGTARVKVKHRLYQSVLKALRATLLQLTRPMAVAVEEPKRFLGVCVTTDLREPLPGTQRQRCGTANAAISTSVLETPVVQTQSAPTRWVASHAPASPGIAATIAQETRARRVQVEKHAKTEVP